EERAIESVDHHRGVHVLEDARLDELILPPPPSSAGVPITWTRPFGSWPLTAASAAPAPAPEVAMMLWPHACPIPGSASYSQRMATVGPSPVSMVARKAVSTPPTPCSTLKPCLPRNSESQ